MSPKTSEPHSWSLTTRLRALLLAVSLVPLVGLALYEITVVRARVMDASAARSLQRARATAQALDLLLEDAASNIAILAESAEAIRLLQEPSEQHRADTTALIASTREHWQYNSLLVTDQAGTVVAASETRLLGREYVATRSFLEAIAGRTFVDDPRWDAQDGQLYFHFAAPVRDARGVILGVALGRMTLNVIDRLSAADNDFGGAGEFGVVWDERGVTLTGAGRLGGRSTALATVPEDVKDELIVEGRFGPDTKGLLDRAGPFEDLLTRSKLLLYDHRTDPHLVLDSPRGRLNLAVAPLAQKRWLYGIFTPEETLLSGIRTRTMSALFAGLMVAGLVFAAASIGAWIVVSNPVRALAEAAQAVASGDLTKTVTTREEGALGNLASAFNSMVQSLSRKDAELRHYTTQLERMVEERTSALRASEAQQRQSQKMEAIGLLAGSVAHDFNNLLTVINGYGEILQQSVGQDSTMRPDVEEILRAGKSAATLTQQLLAFSRHQILQPTVLDLNDAIRAQEAMLHRLIGEDVAVVAKLAPDLWRVKVDAGQIGQVLMNLAVNARDAMPHGGTLTIETANATVEADTREQTVTPGRWVTLAVRDTGHGMTPEVQARIFEPFFTTKERGKGTGLGLSTVHGIVEQSGGHVSVHSTIGQGTSFLIFLPRAEEPLSEPVTTRPPEPKRRGTETILVVDDDSGVRALVHRSLETRGYRVISANNGAQALDLSERRAGQIDLLVTDVVMPGMSGPALAKRLAASRPAMRVLYMSGYAGDAIDRVGLAETGVSFLRKPFTPEGLEAAVQDVLA